MKIPIHLNTPGDCACDLIGDGSEHDPIRIEWCPLHAAAACMRSVLVKLPCHCLGDFRAPDTASEQHLPGCPKALAKDSIARSTAHPTAGDAHAHS